MGFGFGLDIILKIWGVIFVYSRFFILRFWDFLFFIFLVIVNDINMYFLVEYNFYFVCIGLFNFY